MPPWCLDIFLFSIGIVALLGGGDVLVRGAIALAERFGISPLVVGLTVVAFGTSAPELALNIAAALNGNSDLSFGNVVGSNIANIGLILGIAAMCKPLDVHAAVVRRELPLMLGATCVYISLSFLPDPLSHSGFTGVGRFDAAVLILCFAAFMWIVLRTAKRDRNTTTNTPDHTRQTPVALSIGLVVLGLVLLVAGGKLAEMGAVGLAKAFGMSNELIGLTVVALATSLPELATSLMAVRKGQTDLAVGNIVGSNIFNVLLVMGTTAFVAPVPMGDGAWHALAAMAILSVLLWPISMTSNRRISRLEGAALFAMYVGFMGWQTVAAIAN